MTHPSTASPADANAPAKSAGTETPNQNAKSEKPISRLEHFPNAFFAVIMGLAGLTLATERLEKSLGYHHSSSYWLMVITGVIFAILLAIYAVKAMRYPAMVKWEWHHPVRMCFFPAISIGLLLMATAATPFSRTLSLTLWALGSVLHLLGTLAVLGAWIGHRPFDTLHLSPAWFIPVVGNIIVPIVAARLGYVETGWFFFAVGIIFWIVLQTLVFNRLVFHNPLPERLLPTLMILIAPPAVGFISYVGLTGMVDPLARILFYTGIFFFLIILTQVPKMTRIPFALSWWAYSFPMAALTISTLLYAEKVQSNLHRIAGMAFYGLLVLLIVGLILRTAKAIANRQVCHPE